MRGASRTAYDEVAAQFDEVAASVEPGELFEVVALLDREHGLRRTVSDPARPAEQKTQIVRVLLEGKVSAATLRVVEAAVAVRWGRSGDLGDTLERLAVYAAADRADAAGQLDDLEDELFRFGRLIESNPELRSTLGNPALPAEGKRALLAQLLSGKATPATIALVSEAATRARGRSLDKGLDQFGQWVAQRKQRLVAVVRSAVALTEEQKARIGAWLRGTYGREVHLNIEVDPQVLGGFSVRVGDEIIDTTIAGRMEEVRRRLAG
ncbi:F0F1 ATP synthase subunit delta [Bailinhaonella thermotolerans]|uniref:ATP synthase subunit delta n=1 Tax=Bailinhaonella thermotolerans TaxID=1070861 RepID=A0A3A4AEX6_9ACTN|nr:F0F1 ATP synthase subunit delta [Bailinhaonella thermotolerans]RJL24580.1 F0F1 ATP synthase subunit delta [Bailinhaonella thermotolerans]